MLENQFNLFTAISSESGGSFRPLDRFLVPVFLEQQVSCLFGVCAKKLKGLSLILSNLDNKNYTALTLTIFFFFQKKNSTFTIKKSVAQNFANLSRTFRLQK